MSEQTHTFDGLGIAPALLAAVERLGFKAPTPIQVKTIPAALVGTDVMGIAQTGTGKTLAFGIPLIQGIFRTEKQALVVAPTRELALQIDEMITSIGRPMGLRTAVIIGGVSYTPQVRALARKPHIIIATPGRLIDHLKQKNVRLDDVGFAVLDEADRMLDMGFLPQVKRILEALPAKRQTLVFSATMPPEIMRIVSSHMRLPVRVEIAPAGTVAERVTQELFIVPREQKTALLVKLLGEGRGPTLVFSRTKHGAKRVTHIIREAGFAAAEIHSNRSLNQRREALAGFKSGRYRVLVATDIASRGIDVSGIELVVNLDLPSTSDDYVHRIGRTARAGAAGHAVTFAMPGEEREVRAIERLIRKPLPVSKIPPLPVLPRRPISSHAHSPHHRYGPAPRHQGGRRRDQGRGWHHGRGFRA